MNKRTIKAYHTCKNENGEDYIKKNVPFLSEPQNQWLGCGYYFWTDSTFWAKKWRKGEKRVVSEFTINIPENKLLDLVGNVDHQEKFLNCFQQFADFFSDKGRDTTISEMIYFLLGKRNHSDEIKKLFPYWAVKVKDNRLTEKKKFLYDREETMSFIERQQLCVFEGFKEKCVKFEKICLCLDH